jgi:hypothetical protein
VRGREGSAEQDERRAGGQGRVAAIVVLVAGIVGGILHTA